MIAAYNAGAYIGATLESVLAQSFRDFEVLVVDDGSTDDTREVVGSFRDERVLCLSQPNSGGPSRPRNTGIRQARGTHIAIFDSDDVMFPSKLEAAMRFLSYYPRVGLVFTDFMLAEGPGLLRPRPYLAGDPMFRRIRKFRIGPSMYLIPSRSGYAGLIEGNYIGTSSVVIPRRVLEEVGAFDESLCNSEDRDLWFRIARRHDIGFMDVLGHCYRIREGSILNSGYELAPNRIRVMERQLAVPMSFRLRRTARKIIARNYTGMGYHQQALGNYRVAKEHYRKGLKYRITYPALKGIAMSALGGKIYLSLKGFASRIRGRRETLAGISRFAARFVERFREFYEDSRNYF